MMRVGVSKLWRAGPKDGDWKGLGYVWVFRWSAFTPTGWRTENLVHILRCLRSPFSAVAGVGVCVGVECKSQ